jgi:excinuclease ABC subunit A
VKNADWLVDLGPGAGDKGGYVVAEGTPEQVATMESSHTGTFLKVHLAAPAVDEAAAG